MSTSLPTTLAVSPASEISQADMYFLAARARSKLTKEASRHDHDLRVLVTHANLLDNVMDSLAEARRQARKIQLEKMKQMQMPQTQSIQVTFELPVKNNSTNIQIIEENEIEHEDKEIIVSNLHTPTIVSREVEDEEEDDEYYTSSDSDSDEYESDDYSDSDEEEENYFYEKKPVSQVQAVEVDIVDSLHSNTSSTYRGMPTIEEEDDEEPSLCYSSSEEEEEEYISSYTHTTSPVYKNHKLNNSQTQLGLIEAVY